jgi:hypothetical protein
MKKIILVFLTIGLIVSVSSYANAQGFTKQNIQGNYGWYAIYGDNEGTAVGVMTSDGNGNMSATLTSNLPGLIIQARRNILKATAAGTYAVESNGMVSVEFTITFVDVGMNYNEIADCVIMQADGTKTATEMFCSSEEPLTMLRGFRRGGAITMTFKRLPD